MQRTAQLASEARTRHQPPAVRPWPGVVPVRSPSLPHKSQEPGIVSAFGLPEDVHLLQAPLLQIMRLGHIIKRPGATSHGCHACPITDEEFRKLCCEVSCNASTVDSGRLYSCMVRLVVGVLTERQSKFRQLLLQALHPRWPQHLQGSAWRATAWQARFRRLGPELGRRSGDCKTIHEDEALRVKTASPKTYGFCRAATRRLCFLSAALDFCGLAFELA